MPYKESNLTSSNSIIDKTQAWVDNGLDVDGIPFFHRINELSFFEIEQLCTDMMFLLIFVFIVVKIIENSKILSILSIKVDILMNKNDHEKFIEKELFRDLM